MPVTGTVGDTRATVEDVDRATALLHLGGLAVEGVAVGAGVESGGRDLLATTTAALAGLRVRVTHPALTSDLKVGRAGGNSAIASHWDHSHFCD